jgi:DNA-binding transcriptional ArsR family regulator
MQNKRQLTPKMHQSLASVLLPEYRRRVLGLLLLRPDEALHGREIARRTGLPAGTVTRELTRLAEVGLLNREKRGNQQLYSADQSCPVFTELASILRKTSGKADEFTSKAKDDPFLRDVLSKPKIFLIGDEGELEELVGREP